MVIAKKPRLKLTVYLGKDFGVGKKRPLREINPPKIGPRVLFFGSVAENPLGAQRNLPREK